MDGNTHDAGHDVRGAGTGGKKIGAAFVTRRIDWANAPPTSFTTMPGKPSGMHSEDMRASAGASDSLGATPTSPAAPNTGTATSSTESTPGDSQPEEPCAAPGAMPTREQFERLVKAANGGDKQALAALRDILDNNPAVWRQIGDLAALAEAALVSLVAGDDCLAAESLQRSIAEMKAKLHEPGAAYLDELAASRVVSCWLQLQHAEAGLTRSDPGSGPAKFWLKRQAQADRAYHSALKSLSTLRRFPAATSSVVQRPAQPAPVADTPLAAGQVDGGTIPISRYKGAEDDHPGEIRATGS